MNWYWHIAVGFKKIIFPFGLFIFCLVQKSMEFYSTDIATGAAAVRVATL